MNACPCSWVSWSGLLTCASLACLVGPAAGGPHSPCPTQSHSPAASTCGSSNSDRGSGNGGSSSNDSSKIGQSFQQRKLAGATMLSVGGTAAKHACCWPYILRVAVNCGTVHWTAEQVVKWIIMGQGCPQQQRWTHPLVSTQTGLVCSLLTTPPNSLLAAFPTADWAC